MSRFFSRRFRVGSATAWMVMDPGDDSWRNDSSLQALFFFIRIMPIWILPGWCVFFRITEKAQLMAAPGGAPIPENGWPKNAKSAARRLRFFHFHPLYLPYQVGVGKMSRTHGLSLLANVWLGGNVAALGAGQEFPGNARVCSAIAGCANRGVS
jgi:hypothetical protein